MPNPILIELVETLHAAVEIHGRCLQFVLEDPKQDGGSIAVHSDVLTVITHVANGSLQS
jgi:hypothetical protein